jgi:hypothetical protein
MTQRFSADVTLRETDGDAVRYDELALAVVLHSHGRNREICPEASERRVFRLAAEDDPLHRYGTERSRDVSRRRAR